MAGFSDSFTGTAGSTLVSHTPTAVGTNATEAGTSYSAVGGSEKGDQFALLSGSGVRVSAASGAAHVASNVATPTGTFTVAQSFVYRTGGNSNTNIGTTVFDDGTGPVCSPAG